MIHNFLIRTLVTCSHSGKTKNMLLSLFYEKKFNMSWFLAPFRGDQWPMRYVYTCININLHFRTSLMCIKSLQSFLLLLKVFGQWRPFRLTSESFWINPRSWSTLCFLAQDAHTHFVYFLPQTWNQLFSQGFPVPSSRK